MSKHSRSHLDDQTLKRRVKASAAGERTATVGFLADIAEFDARRLYAPDGYDSTYTYCLRELRLSEDAAIVRIRVARVARQFPQVFDALEEGRLHLTGVFQVSRHVTAENGAELLVAAEGKSKAEILLLLAERFPQPDLPSRLEAVSAAGSPVPEQVKRGLLPVPEQVTSPAPRPRVAPLSPERFALQVTIDQDTYENLRYAQTLLGHSLPSGDVAEVLNRALQALVTQLEKQKFARTSRPGRQRSSADPRHIPAAVKRAVIERDGGKCTFVAEDGHCCGSDKHLEFDHVDPVACGGEATVDNVRLRCRAHNLYEAECVFGAGFMEAKREAAKLAAAEARAKAAAVRQAAAEERAKAAAEERERAELERDPERSVIPWLRQLGYDLADAREAAKLCEHMTDAPMEKRIKAALRYSLRRAVMADARSAVTVAPQNRTPKQNENGLSPSTNSTLTCA